MKKILICDDALFMRTLIRKALEPLGYDVVGEAENGAQAITMARELKPDLMTLDIVMPEMDGITALERIRKEEPGIRVVMVTAVDQREYMQKAMRLGIADFIVKPFDDSRVISAIDRALSRAWP